MDMTPKDPSDGSADGDEVRLNGEVTTDNEEVHVEADPSTKEEQEQEEDDTAVLTDQSTTSLSTQGDRPNEVKLGSTSGTPPHAKPPRSSFATRQTVEEMESLNKNKQVGRCARSCRCGETQPGAVAVDGASSEGELSSSTSAANNNSTAPPREHVVLDIEDNEDDTNCHRHQAMAEDIPMIQAELAEETPIAIRAELVVPPPVAYRVQFDEEAPPDPTAPPVRDNERPVPVVAPPVAFRPLEDPADMKKLFSRRNVKWFIRCQVFLLVLGLVLGIVIPKLQDKQVLEKEIEEDLQSFMEDDYHFPIPEAAPVTLSAPVGAPSFEPPSFDHWTEDVPSPTSAPTPRPSVTPVYDCFKSTFEIAVAQLENPKEDGQYVLCPNIRYNVGTLNEDQTKIVNGGYPLTALLDSIEIRCGLDGRRHNHCVLDGGFLQVVLHPPSLPDEELAAATGNRPLDNVVFRGITFTGQLNTTSDLSLGSGTSVYINHPGRNITFVDCAWDNMDAPNGLVQIGDHSTSSDLKAQANNSVASFWEPTMDVTFENCTFSNVEYGGGGTPLISVSGQEATLRRCRFENVSLADPFEPCALGNGNTMEWCQGLMYCLDHSRCELTDICVDNIEYAGPAAVAAASHESQLAVSGSMYVEDLVSPTNLSFLNCSSGLARFADDDSAAPDCWVNDDDEVFMNSTSSPDFCMP